MKEPHASLSAFLGDLHEQCDIFQNQNDAPIVQGVLDKVKQTLASAGFVVAVDAREAVKPKPPGGDDGRRQ